MLASLFSSVPLHRVPVLGFPLHPARHGQRPLERHQPLEVQGESRKGALLWRPGQASEFHPAQPYLVFALAEEFLDSVPAALRERVTEPVGLALHPAPQGLMRAGQVNRQRYVGRDLPSAQTLQIGPPGVVPVGPDRLGPKSVPPPRVGEHLPPRRRLGVSGPGRRHRQHNPGSVLSWLTCRPRTNLLANNCSTTASKSSVNSPVSANRPRRFLESVLWSQTGSVSSRCRNHR